MWNENWNIISSVIHPQYKKEINKKDRKQKPVKVIKSIIRWKSEREDISSKLRFVQS